jgi:hypothetical protein
MVQMLLFPVILLKLFKGMFGIQISGLVGRRARSVAGCVEALRSLRGPQFCGICWVPSNKLPSGYVKIAIENGHL